MNENFKQAPVIVYNGVKNNDTKGWGKAIRSHELETAMMCGLGDRDFAPLKVMLFLTGNAEGFAVAEKTICERCKISKKSYIEARKKLIAMGWITFVPGKSITVNYEAIYEGCSNVTSDEDSFSERCSNVTIERCSNVTIEGRSNVTSERCSEVTYNNIIGDRTRDNIKENNITIESSPSRGRALKPFVF